MKTCMIACSAFLVVCLAVPFAMAGDIAPMDLTKAPEKDEHTVLLLHLDKGEGDVADDDSGLDNKGKISGATWCEGKFGKALQFDGVDDYMTCMGERSQPPHFDFGETTDFTVEFWLNTTSTRRGCPLVNKKLRGGAEEPGFSVGLDAGIVRSQVSDGTNLVNLVHDAKIADGKWHHVALVVERKKNATLFVDGVAGGSQEGVERLVLQAGVKVPPGGIECCFGKGVAPDRRQQTLKLLAGIDRRARQPGRQPVPHAEKGSGGPLDGGVGGVAPQPTASWLRIRTSTVWRSFCWPQGVESAWRRGKATWKTSMASMCMRLGLSQWGMGGQISRTRVPGSAWRTSSSRIGCSTARWIALDKGKTFQPSVGPPRASGQMWCTS